MVTKVNPWLEIDAEDYVKHMSHKSVVQLQLLNKITKEQLTSYTPEKVLILGIATGNGLENIDNKITKNVFGIDINPSYLEICKKMYSSKFNSLELFKLDLNTTIATIDKVDLVIANLFIEYVPINRVLKQFAIVGKKNTVLSIVIQKNHNCTFVSKTGIDSLNKLESIHTDIDQTQLEQELQTSGYIKIKDESYCLPNGKELIRIDYKTAR